MISDLDIWRAAQLIIKHHDTEAPFNPDPFKTQRKGKPRPMR